MEKDQASQENKPEMKLEMGGAGVEEAEVVESTVKEEPKIKQFEYGDLTLSCSCGHKGILEKRVQGGIRIMLPATDMHKLVLACPKCGTSICLYYEENTEPQDESISEDDKTD